MQNHVERFVKDESGATAIEYGLIAALIAVGIIAAARGLGSQISATFNTVTSHDEVRVSGFVARFEAAWSARSGGFNFFVCRISAGQAPRA